MPAALLVLGSAVSVQSGSALAKSLFNTLGPPGVVFLRLLFGTILIGIATRPRLHGWTQRQLLLAAGLGTTLAALNLTFYEAIARTPLGIAVTVEFVGPLAIAIAGSRRAFDLVWVALAGGGVILLVAGGGGHGGSPFGIGLSALAGVLWAIYIVLGGHIGRSFADNAALFPAMAVGALWLLPWGIVSVGRHLLDTHILLTAAGVGALSSAIPWSLELAALRRLPARVFGVLVSLTPAVAALSGFLFLGERLRPHAWLALALVVAASVGAMRQHPDPLPRDA